MGKICGALLDVDGTLIDSNDAHARSWAQAFQEFGIRVLFSQVRPLIGKGGDKIIAEFTGWDPEGTESKKLSKRRREIFKDILPSLRAFPKVPELLARMREAGLRMVVASSATSDELEALLHLCDPHRDIEEKTSSDDVERSKPDPEIVVAALKEISLPSSQVLMLGDTPYDLEASSRAGVRIIAFRCGGWNDRELAGAAAIYDDPAELLDRFETSPLVA
jgi:phosphoglycolate phosphatase-like HAD superfamily hydrolase